METTEEDQNQARLY